MKAWKKAVSAALCICLAVSLFTGFSLTDVAAAEYGTLQNGALTENTTGLSCLCIHYCCKSAYRSTG